MIWATIIDRNNENLRDKIITITPVVPFREMLSTVSTVLQKRRFLVFESCVYFEAYRHVLKSLQRLVKLPPSLENYFIFADKNVPHPDYLDAMSSTNLSIDLSCLYKNNTRTPEAALFSSLDLYKHLNKDGGSRKVVVDGVQEGIMKLEEFQQLPAYSSNSFLKVNESQLKAIQSVFRHKISLIQGPPGTGKSYVGKLMVQLLLENRQLWSASKRCPILVVCYTNRALDSFLESMTDVTQRIIRIGGRSKSEKLEIHNLLSIKRGKII